jgi:hypothetical protein
MKGRAKRDLADCLRFIAAQPWGNAAAREQDIRFQIQKIREGPMHRRVDIVRKGSGVELRRRSAAQFVIIYAYFKPRKRLPLGLVSIRAIRHRRVRDVFSGVRQPTPPPPPYGTRYQT